MSTASDAGDGDADFSAARDRARRAWARYVAEAGLDLHPALMAQLSVDRAGNPLPDARVRKVSVSLPENLTAAVRQRVGKGEFSHYVTEAVARQLELDLLAELAESLDAEHGPIAEEYLAEARAAWPDAE